MTTLPTLHGRLVSPDDDGYDEARQGFNLAVDQQPAAVAEAASVADVQAVVRHALTTDVRVAPQATGHGSEALALDALRGAILLKTAGLDTIAVDPAARTATIGAGVTAGALSAAAAEHSLAPVLGLAPSVGVAGLTLGGGLGWLSRTHGTAAAGLLDAEVVTATGEVVQADDDVLFALRGGGGRGTVVTSLTVALHPIDEVSAGMIAWPAERAGEVLEQVRRVALNAPDALSLVFRVLSLPPLDVIPEPIRGRRIAAVVACHLGPHADGERLLAPLRGGDDVLLDGFGPVAVGDLVRVAGDPEAPGAARGGGFLLDELTPDAVAAVAGLVQDEALQALTVMEVRQLGGALRRAPVREAAVGAIDAGWGFFAGGMAGDADAAAAVTTALEIVRTRLAPFAAPRTLLSLAALGADPATGYPPGVWDRLAA
ncbi:MAG: FAD-binding protein, partial [Solirubrobacterales bacterium]